jgi:hypothetical protein
LHQSIDELGLQISEEIQQEKEVNSDQLLMRRVLLAFEKESRLEEPAPLLDRITEET